MTPNDIKRYARHLVLKEIGGPGQQALLDAKVAIIGAGGLGGPIGLYLAAAGLGTLTIIDDDQVDISNLQRQIQFTSSHIGQNKTEAMAQQLQAINPNIAITPYNIRLSTKNATSLLKDHDLILDGTDNFETRFIINQTSLALNIPLLSGALGRFDGQVAIFNRQNDAPCYRCLVPHIPPHAPTCSEVGIVGAMAGVIGSIMALETIKYISGAGTLLDGKLWIFDGLSCESRTATLHKDPLCPACS